MKKISLKKLMSGCMVLGLTACATVFSGTTQTINVQVVDENNAQIQDVKCIVTDGKGLTYPVLSNPGAFTVTKGNGALNPSCKKDGYTQKSFGVGDSFNAVTLVNVLFWPGFIVDAISGSAKDYPSHITVFMEKDKPCDGK